MCDERAFPSYRTVTEEPYVVVSGFATILADPALDADNLGRPEQRELSLTGVSADGEFYRVVFEDQTGWVHSSAVLRIEGDLADVLVVNPTIEAVPASSGPALARRLQAYDSDWSSAIVELQDLEIIPSGGGLVFEEDYAFLTGNGSFFVALSSQRPETDIVMAGEITYTTGSQTSYETCMLISRIETDEQGDARHFLQVGLDNARNVVVFDRFGQGDTQSNLEFVETRVDLGVPHHFLILALDDRLTVYLDGELVLQDFEIDEHAGIYGISLRGQGIDAHCAGRDIWVYQVPYAQPGVCEIQIDRTVNMRSGPGTNFEQAGQLVPGTTRRAQAATLGEDGFIWWQMENQRWVRNDVVNAVGYCQNLPGPDAGPTI